MKYVLATLSFIAFLIQNLAATERPNVVMIFTDDQRHDAVGYAGNDAVHTPNLDGLARQGLIFQNCFVNTSICAISRANLLSGQYPGRHGIDDFHQLMLFFKAPHAPFTDWDPATEHLTDGRQMPRPSAATLANAEREPEIIKQSLGRPSGMRYLQDPKWFDRHMRDYYRLIASMDTGVGRIMQSLKQRGLDQNTVVLFTSDNGHYKGEHGLAGKWLMHEPSLRVPGFLFDPRQPSGKTTDRMVITTDFSVTLLSLAGVPVPDNMTGLDLHGLYAESPENWREDF